MGALEWTILRGVVAVLLEVVGLDIVDTEVVVVGMSVVVSDVVVVSMFPLSILSMLVDVTSCEEDEDELVSSGVVV